MKLLLFSDLHCDEGAARKLVHLAQDVDLVIGAGDFGNLRRNVGDCVRILSSIQRDAVLVAGNNESTDELREAARVWKSAHVLHGTAVTLQGISIFGIGGGIPVTPFGAWSYDLAEDDATKLLNNATQADILVSHSPPQGVVDRSSSGQSLGSTAVLAAVARLRPQLVVCGHIHASAGRTEQLGPTDVVNAGPKGIVRSLHQT